MDEYLRKEWKFMAAARAYHIDRTGFDATVAGQYKNQAPTTIPTATHNVYAHLLDPTNPAAANRLETLIFENGDQMETQTQKGVTA